MDINQNQVTKNVAGFSGWDNCPADVLLMIFAQLDTRSLLICMDVNQWWREIFEYVAQVSRFIFTFHGKLSLLPTYLPFQGGLKYCINLLFRNVFKQ